MYIKYQPTAKLLFVFYNVYSLTFKGTIGHYPNSMPQPYPPHTKRQLRQEPISNFNTITYFYIYIHLHKKIKAKQLYCQKISLSHKTHKSQHKSDYERERERERENRKRKEN